MKLFNIFKRKYKTLVNVVEYDNKKDLIIYTLGDENNIVSEKDVKSFSDMVENSKYLDTGEITTSCKVSIIVIKNGKII